ncbi:MAG: hypothetical protein LBB94_01750 [Clostridiales bacterium]|jgi:hypothetical protein|nr:hypothetical protein [Clostridiales bacterium]
MVVYYSWEGHARAYAKELAVLRKDTIFELREKKRRFGILGFISGCFQSVTKKEAEITGTPDLRKEKEIFICSPVWASCVTPAVRYFINHTRIEGITVNFLLTCASIDKQGDYTKAAFDALKSTEAEHGEAYVFACPRKSALDTEIIRSHIKKVILGVD